jgi:multidrug efflux pump subunit AcrB
MQNLLKRNVIANILMSVFIMGGLISAQNIRQEYLPTSESHAIQISVGLEGAQPAEIETSILMPIENAIGGMDGIKKMEAEASENAGSVRLTLLENVNIQQMLGDVKSAVDRIETFPEEAEEPSVTVPAEIEAVLSLIVFGDQPLLWLRGAAESIRKDLLTEIGLTKVELFVPRDQEISIELSEENLRLYGLTLEDVAQKLQDNALDMPSGTLYDKNADIALRINERREWASKFSDIVIAKTHDGVPLKLSQIATLKDGFGNSPIEAWYNGQPAIQITVFAAGKETPASVEELVENYLSTTAAKNYPGIGIDIFENDAKAYRERVSLLVNNAFIGLVLVMILLGLFLTPRLAFWVMAGIPTALLGGLIILPLFGASINMISLFAFIVTLGVTVDDTIMIGEAVYANRAKGMKHLDAAVQGIKEMGISVLLAVSTTILAFIPMFFVPGPMGILFKQIPAVVISVLLVSLVESLFILGAHLAEENPEKAWIKKLSRPQGHINAWLEDFTNGTFKAFVQRTLQKPFSMLAIAFSLLLITIGAVKGGLVGFTFSPSVQADTVIAQVTLPYGSPKAQSIAIQEKLVKDAKKVFEESDMQIPGIFSLIGARLDEGEIEEGTLSGSHYISVMAALPDEDARTISGRDFAKKWRTKFGDPGGMEAMTFTGEKNVTGGKPIRLELFHPDESIASAAAKVLGERMHRVAGLTSIDDGLRAGKPELKIKLKKDAVHLGLNAQDIAEQLRSRYYGAEALRIARDGNDVKVMVRLSEEERTQISALENALLKTPSGNLVPLTEIATITQERSTTNLARRDGRRIYPVSADIMSGVSDDVVEGILEDSMIPQLIEEYPGLRVMIGGGGEDDDEALSALGYNFIIVLGLMYVLLAIQFNSYILPLIVLSVIPFATIGAVWGHIVFGYDISIISVVGFIAMAGVIVNDSLVLVTTYNQYIRQAIPHSQAIVDAACRRLRPIILTTLTTFFGLAPLMLETSEQAQFLIPMAVSLSFGLMFGTLIVLVLLPVLCHSTRPMILKTDGAAWEKQTFDL